MNKTDDLVPLYEKFNWTTGRLSSVWANKQGNKFEFPTMNDAAVDKVTDERGKIYGDPLINHTNIGLAWTALINSQAESYNILKEPIRPEVVCQMMVMLKLLRMGRVYHEDNYLDAAAYMRFSNLFQQQKSIDNKPKL